MTEQTDVHFFGSTVHNWFIGSTRVEVLQYLAKAAGASVIKDAVTRNGGLRAFTCRVLAPMHANYKISEYVPVGVPTDRGQDFRICSVKGYGLPIEEK